MRGLVGDLLILRYQAVSPDRDSPLAVSPGAFERQLTRLLAHGYRPATFTAATAALSAAGDDRRVLVVSFDGGFRSVHDHALPLLRTLGIAATAFVPTGLVGSGAAMAPAAPAGDLLDWEQLRALAAAEWELGTQGRQGIELATLDDRELADELAGAREDLRVALGITATSLAYPGGVTDTRVMASAADAGYVAAAGMPRSLLYAPLALAQPRVTVLRGDGRLGFALKTWSRGRELRTLTARAPRPVLRGLPEADDHPAGAASGARVAVLIPCFNDGHVIGEALASIEEHEPVEVVVIDDCSTDPDTLAVLDGLRRRGVHVVRHERNQGLPAARMTGLRATHAPYVFPLDSDDLAVPGALSAMADCLDRRPDAAVCFGDYLEFGGEAEYLRSVPPALDAYRVAYRNDYPVSSLFRRSALESVGGWQGVGGEVGYEDWNLWMTLAERGAIGIHWGRGVAFRRRVHGTRMLGSVRSRHIALYLTLRTLHPQLFSELRRHRRTTTLGPRARLLYPVLYGWRPPMSLLGRTGGPLGMISTAIRRRLDSA
jgi:peptidoglycan/xylan/chitin deacetylase (PgdA/CDA1 family)